MVKIIDVVQGSPEWHELRKTKLGASCAPIICGISHYMTAFELYQQMKGITEPEEENWGMERGKRLEKEAIQLFENTEGFKTFQPVGQSDIHDCLIASMDAVCVEDHKKCSEVKCLGIEDHSKTYLGDIPELYYPQLQHQMFVWELDQIEYRSYNPDAFMSLTRPVVVKRDVSFLKEYIPKALAFMDCIYSNTPPPMTDKDWHDCTGDDALEYLSEDYMIAYNECQLAEERKERTRKALIAYAGDRKVKGNMLKVSKYTRQGQVDYKKIPDLQYINLDKFRGPSVESYRIDRVR